MLSLVRLITTAEELAEATSRRKAVLHLDVDWSVQARKSRAVMQSFQELAVQDSMLEDVAFYRVDCSDQAGALWDALGNWLTTQAIDRLLKPGASGTQCSGQASYA